MHIKDLDEYMGIYYENNRETEEVNVANADTPNQLPTSEKVNSKPG